MKLLWTLLKVVLALVLIVPVTIIVLGTVLGILGTLFGLAVLALKVVVVGLVAYGAFKLIARLMGGPKPAPTVHREAVRLAPVDPYYESAMRELDRELDPRAH